MPPAPSTQDKAFVALEPVPEFTAFEARKGRLPTFRELQENPQLHKATVRVFDSLTGADPDLVHGYSYADYPHASAASTPGCVDKCDICRSHWLVGLAAKTVGYSTCHTDEDAQDQLDLTRSNIEQDYLHIRDRLEKHGDTLVKRWHKRNPTKRAALLRQVLPKMYPKRGFPLLEFLNAGPAQLAESPDERMARLRVAWLLPYLSLESLSESPLELVALLYHRIEHQPTDWTLFDFHQHEYAFKPAFVQSAYNPHCVDICGARYGKLIPFQKQGLHAALMISFPRANLLFDAQNILYKFLSTLVDLILGPADNDTKPTGRNELNRLATGHEGAPSGLRGDWSAQNLPFAGPPRFDIHDIREKFSLRLRAAEDELEMLQTDPLYFREQLIRADLSGKIPDKRYCELVNLTMMNFRKHDNWKFLLAETEVTAKALGDRMFALPDNELLPKDYDEALSLFQNVLTRYFKIHQKHLMILLLASKGFHRFVTKREDNTVEVDADLRKMSRGDPLLYNLMELSRYDEVTSGLHASSMFQYLDDILAHSTHQNASRVSRAMYMVISDMAVIDQALTAVKFHRPPCAPVRQIMAEHGIVDMDSMKTSVLSLNETSAIKAAVLRILEESRSELSYEGAAESGYKELYAPLAAFLATPAPTGRTNRSALDALTRSHEALKAFWHEVQQWRRASLKQRGCGERMTNARVQCLTVSGSLRHEMLFGVERKSLLTAVEARGESIMFPLRIDQMLTSSQRR